MGPYYSEMSCLGPKRGGLNIKLVLILSGLYCNHFLYLPFPAYQHSQSEWRGNDNVRGIELCVELQCLLGHADTYTEMIIYVTCEQRLKII